MGHGPGNYPRIETLFNPKDRETSLGITSGKSVRYRGCPPPARQQRKMNIPPSTRNAVSLTLPQHPTVGDDDRDVWTPTFDRFYETLCRVGCCNRNLELLSYQRDRGLRDQTLATDRSGGLGQNTHELVVRFRQYS